MTLPYREQLRRRLLKAHGYTTTEMSIYLNTSPRTIRRYIADGLIHAIRLTDAPHSQWIVPLYPHIHRRTSSPRNNQEENNQEDQD